MNNTNPPPYLMTSDKGSFAEKTIAERKPSIIKQILLDFDYTPTIRKSLLDYKNEIAEGLIKPLRENASDKEIWDRELKPWKGKTWFEVPWLLAEAYFYRRVLETTHYFQPGPYQGSDPFQRLKTKEMLDGLVVFEELYPHLTELASLEGFKAFCIKALWGNRGDLSHTEDSLDPSMETQSHHIILDDTNMAYQYLTAKQPVSVAYFFDNVGKELFFDIALIDFLLNSGLAVTVSCFLKNQPFFVSDAMPKDFFKTIELMRVSEDMSIQRLSERIQKHLRSEHLTIEAPPFMTQPQMYHELPEVLREQVATHDIAILKGDVNYRRLMGDRHWPPKTPVEVAGGYFPTTFMSLRTLKAEMVVGLTDAILDKVKSESDPDWLINGQRGVITFLQK